MKKLIQRYQDGDSVNQEQVKKDQQQQKKKLVPKKKSKYLNPEFVNDRPVPMIITHKNT